MLKAAIVILNWNGKKFLERFLPSVIKNSDCEGCRVIVADNGSVDDSVEFLHTAFPEVLVIRLDKNYGFALGYVKALDQIDAEYFVLLNSDVEVTPGWLNPLIDLMDNDKTIGACMPKILSWSNREFFEYAGAAGGMIDKFGYPFCRGRILNVIEKDNGQYDDLHEIFWASGACMFVRSSAYYEAGELDGDFFAHMEEIDLCWRMKKKGFRIMVNPAVSVYHVGGGTLPNDNPHKIYLNYRNSLYLLFKNLPSGRFLPLLLSRLIFDMASSVLYLLSFRFRFSLSVIKAHFDFYSNLLPLIRKRKVLQKNSENHFTGQVLQKSILIEFFLKKKKYFRDLGM